MPSPTLKEARIAIDSNEHAAAAEICRRILSANADNYMALVLLGVALKGDVEAEAAYERAISLKPDGPLAYQGLSKYYANGGGGKGLDERLNAYARSYELNGSSHAELCDRVRDAAVQFDEWKKPCDTLTKTLANATDESERSTIKRAITKIICETSTPETDEFLTLCETILNCDELAATNSALLIKYLYCVRSIRGHGVMFDLAVSYSRPSGSRDFEEWLCNRYVEAYAANGDVTPDSSSMSNIIERVMNAVPNSLAGKLATIVNHVARTHALTAYVETMKLTKKLETPIISMLRARCCIELNRFVEAEYVARSLLSVNNALHLISVKKMLARALSSQSDSNKRCEAIEMLNGIAVEHLRDAEYVTLFYAHLGLNAYSDAQKYLNKLTHDPKYASLNAIFLKECNKINEAIELVLNDESNPISTLQLATLYCVDNRYRDALLLLLQSANHFPHDSVIFLHLGNYYLRDENHIEKAKRCFIKTLELNPECVEAAKTLNKVYVDLKDWESNFALLNSIKQYGSCIEGFPSQWAWQKMGLHHYALQQWDDAIVNLRTYIRWNAFDVETWATLADTYYSRGSYTSSLKCLRKTVDIDPSRKQCYIQIGTIECLLGHLDDALCTFESIANDFQLPALKGLGEVKLAIAKEMYSNFLFGQCRDTIQNAIDLAVQAICIEKKFICFWKILYNSILFINKLPQKYNWLYLDLNIITNTKSERRKYCNKNDLFDLAIECMEKMIHLSPIDLHHCLHHELAFLYYNFYIFSKNDSHIMKAYEIIINCLEIDENKWHHWNLLGIICSTKSIKKYEIAQHAFIKALEIDPSNASLWGNLGVFYLLMGKNMFANRAFMKAQESNPTYIQSWIGQAMIAEGINSHETIDLYRHATQLGFNKECSIRYAHLITTNPNDKLCEVSVENTKSAPTACDLISVCCDFNGHSASNLNTYGILLEKMGFFDKAIKVYKKALSLDDAENNNAITVNLGRAYFCMKNYGLTIKTLESLPNHDGNSACLLAFSYFHKKEYEKSYSVYNNMLKCASSDSVVDNFLIVMASTVFKILNTNIDRYGQNTRKVNHTSSDDHTNNSSSDDNKNDCNEKNTDGDFSRHSNDDKSIENKDRKNIDNKNKELSENNHNNVFYKLSSELLIFELMEMYENESHTNALFALSSLCVLASDPIIVPITLNELKSISNTESHNDIIILLETYFIYKFAGLSSAKPFLLTRIPEIPQYAFLLWRYISYLSTDDVSDARKTVRMALLFPENHDFLPLIQLASITEIISGDINQGKMFAQKAITMDFSNAENWCLLILANMKMYSTGEADDETKIWLKKVISHILSDFNVKKNLKTWLLKCNTKIV